MTGAQKAIKYCAIAFAIFLIVSILGGIISAVSGLSALLSGESAVGEMKTYTVTAPVEKLIIDIGAARLTIQTGDGFRLESNHKYLEAEQDGTSLTIRDDTPGFLKDPEGVRVTLTIPAETEFALAEIRVGAGALNVDTLAARQLRLDLGAGEVRIRSLSASSKAVINGGAGETTIEGGHLADLDFDMGVGEVNMTSRLTGSGKIDYGVGDLNLTLIGSGEDYRIRLDKGLGDARLEGKKMESGTLYGDGENAVEIDGGVGGLNIRFGKE